MTETAWCPTHEKLERILAAWKDYHNLPPVSRRSGGVYCAATLACGEVRHIITTQERFGRMNG